MHACKKHRMQYCIAGRPPQASRPTSPSSTLTSGLDLGPMLPAAPAATTTARPLRVGARLHDTVTRCFSRHKTGVGTGRSAARAAWLRSQTAQLP